ncbi:MAG: hypothetical protein LBE85_02435 [Candidatus Accumulibacter sp.]|jgi:hypothetical protein|nr:hypothetical protein [Accumulibacter sp.]
MNTVSSAAASAAAYVPMTAPQAGKDARAASAPDTTAAASPEAQISPQAKALAEFYDAASAFIREEHFAPFTGWKYSNGSSGYLLNEESAYLDVEKYNNYLFDKAATTLVEQARQLGLALDKDETLAQLKADNADVAAIQYSDAERRKYLEMGQIVAYSGLTHTDVNSLTDLYITAKENGLDASQVGSVAAYLGLYYHHKSVIMMESYSVPKAFASCTAEEIAEHEAKNFARFQDKIDRAGELKAKLSNVRFGFDEESGFFEQFLNPRITLGGVNADTLDFLLQIADLKASGPASGESWTWSPATGWTTDPDSREAAARSAYEEWLAKTAADLEKYFGDKTDKTGKAASSSDKTEVSGELAAALDRITQEKELLARLLRPLTRPATGEDEKRAEPERR